MKISQFLWLLPFLSFVTGYFFTRAVFHQSHIETPSLVGKHLYEAFALLSNQNLSPRLLDQKIDPDLEEGTVINQIPHAGKKVKQRQSVFLVLSKKPPITPTPQLVGKSLSEIKQLGEKKSYKIKPYFVPSNYPSHQCIAQSPVAGKPIEHNCVTTYISTDQKKPIVWPNFINKPLRDVSEFLAQYQIEPHIISHSSRTTSHARVVDQRPLAGSIVSLSPDQLPYVQLHVR